MRQARSILKEKNLSARVLPGLGSLETIQGYVNMFRSSYASALFTKTMLWPLHRFYPNKS